MMSRIEKLDSVKKNKSADAFLISSAGSVKYFSGYFFYFEYGASPFHLLPALLMVIPGEDASLIMADNESVQSAMDPIVNIISYESYTWEKAADPTDDCIKKISGYIEKYNLRAARFGIEPDTLPAVIIQIISERYPEIEWIDVRSEIAALKSIKDTDEIDFIREAAALSDIGQITVLKNAKEGMTELELFSLAHQEMEAFVGRRIPLMADLSSGINTNSGGGMPTDKIIRAGDLILSDFQACLQGYWGDSCSTIVVGAPTKDHKQTFQLVKEGLEIGMQAVKPGVQACEIDRLMREHIGSYPHHSGHSVGTSYHEAPRITPYNKTELQPGMIIALEPAIYKDKFGVRLEHLMLVTLSGCEVLTKFKHEFEQK